MTDREALELGAKNGMSIAEVCALQLIKYEERAEKAEASEKAALAWAAEDRENAEKWQKQKARAEQRAEKAEAACAVLRAGLQAFVEGYADEWPGLLHEEGCPGVRLRPDEREDEDPCECDGDFNVELVREALLADAGRGWLSPEESGALLGRLNGIVAAEGEAVEAERQRCAEVVRLEFWDWVSPSHLDEAVSRILGGGEKAAEEAER